MGDRVIKVGVVPGEPTDGSGRVCIHLFEPSEAGVFVEPHALHPVVKDGAPVKGQVEARATRGRLACDHARSAEPVTRSVRGKTVVTVTPRTDDYRAVTCPKCIASDYYKATAAKVAGA